MSAVNPLSKQQAAPEVHPVYDALTKKFGKVPNIFGTLAHHPGALSSFIPFYEAVTSPSSLSDRDKELAYIATSIFNGCEY